MTSKVLCRYFVHGVCRNGNDCPFAHDYSQQQSMVCKYYLQGNCAYGERCRYDHTRPSYTENTPTTTRPNYTPPTAVPRPVILDRWPDSRAQQNGSAASQPPSQAATRPNGGTLQATAGTGGAAETAEALAAGLHRVALSNDAGTHDQARGNQQEWYNHEENADYYEYGEYDESWQEQQGYHAEYHADQYYNGAGYSQTHGSGQQAEQHSQHDAYQYDQEYAAEGYHYEEGSAYDTSALPHDLDDEWWGSYAEGAAFAPSSASTPSVHAREDGLYDETGCYVGPLGSGAPSGAPSGTPSRSLTRASSNLSASAKPFSPDANAEGPYSPRSAQGPPSGAPAGSQGPSAWSQGLPAHLRAAAAAAANGGVVSTSAGPLRRAPVPPPAILLKGLCSEYFVAGYCHRGDVCTLVHGRQCSICHKYALHPVNNEAAEEHKKECQERHDRLAARRAFAMLECAICLEPVLKKADPKERRFGLLSCEHVFCLGCIRSWRANNVDDFNLDEAVRTCPLCRVPTHFVTPSPVWPSTQQQKDEIVQGYKAHLATIDCRHYDFGSGHCPFNRSCFYRHVDRYGNPAPPSAAAGRALAPATLADYLTLSSVQRRLR